MKPFTVPEGDKIILCSGMQPGVPKENRAECERCEVPLQAYPVSIAMAKKDKTFHLICRTCYYEMESLDPIYAGRVRNNVFQRHGIDAGGKNGQ